MINGICLIQEGQISEDVQSVLTEGISAITHTQFGDTADLTWINIADGDGWTSGKPSSTSVVMLLTPPIDQDHREKVMTLLCDHWTISTGCDVNKILVSLIPIT